MMFFVSLYDVGSSRTRLKSVKVSKMYMLAFDLLDCNRFAATSM